MGKLEERKKVQELRKKGLSYKEILQHVSVSKDTISRWCKDIALTNKQKNRLIQNKSFGQRKGSIVAAENKRQKRLTNIAEIKYNATKKIGSLTDREKFIAGLMLYAAEGTKMDGKGGFTNADPKLMEFMSNWFTKYTNITRGSMRGRIWIHDGLDKERAKDFWSKVIHLPKNQFFKTYVAKRKTGSKKFRKNIHEYGVGSLIFFNTKAHRQIMGWISAVFDAKIASEKNSLYPR